MTFQEAMRATSRELSTRATITAPGFSFTATNEHIMGFTVDEGGVIPLGTASSARCTLDLANANNEWRRGGSLLGNRSLIGATVAIEIGVYHDGAWDWQPVAAFIVDETKAREHDTRFILTGNDPLTRLDVKFNDTMRYTASTTLNDVLNHIKSKGVTISGTLAANGNAIIRYAPEWGDEPTIRQALCYVAQLGGSFVRCARNGSIELAPTNGATVHQINTSSYIDLTDEERVFLFNRIKLMPEGAKKDAVYVQSAVTSTPETAANTLVIEGNPIFKTRSTTSYYKVTGLFDQNKRYYELSAGKYSLVPFEERQEESLYRYYYASTNYNTSILQGIADGLKTALNGLNLRAASFRWRGDPSIKIGDKVTVTDTRGVSFTTTVLRQTFRFDQGFSAEISCPVELEGIAPFIMPAPHFGEGSIPGYAIAENSLVGAQFADGSITNSQIKGGTITGAEIADSTIKNSNIEGGTITGAKIYGGTADDLYLTNANFDNGKISGSWIDGSTFTNGSIKGTAIDTSTFTNGSISGSAINASTFTNGQISGSKIDSSTLTNIPYAQIKDLDVTGDAIFRQSVVGDGTFYLDRLIVNSANIGTATIGELMVRDAQGKLHKVLIGTNGVVSSTEVKVDGQNLSNDAMMQVSQRLVWRQATQPSAPFIGMIWMDTSLTPAGKPKEILKRCTAIAPSVVWEVVQSNELHTNVIDVDDNGMNILTGGNLNLLSGGALNIKNLSGTDNVINMDNTGMTISSTGKIDVESGGKINVSATDLIISGKTVETYASDKIRLEVNVGGKNYVRDAGKAFTVTTYNVDINPGGYTVDPQLVVDAKGKQIVISFDYWYATWLQNSIRREIHIQCKDTADNNVYLVASVPKGLYVPNANNDTFQRWSQVVEFPANIKSIDACYFYVNVLNYTVFKNLKIEVGNKPTAFNYHPDDPASGVKNTYMEMLADLFRVYTGGQIELLAGAMLKILAGTVQIEATSATESFLKFGEAFSVGKGTDGKYKLELNSEDDIGIMVNSNPVWHRGNIVVKSTQPASGGRTLWLKPSSTQELEYRRLFSSRVYYGQPSVVTHSLTAMLSETMSSVGEYAFTVRFKIKRITAVQKVPVISVTGGTCVLTKGSGSLSLSIPATDFYPWNEKEFVLTGTTNSTEFTSGTGAITATITLTRSGTIYADDNLAHVNGGILSCVIRGPGSATAQPCEVFYVP